MSKKRADKLLRFSSMGIQMGLIIGGAAWLGDWLDNKYAMEKPVWTIVLSLSGIAIALYLVIRAASNLSNKNED